MAATREHVIRPLRNRNPRIPVSNRFDGFDPLNMFENGENEVDFGVQMVYQGFKYSHDPSHYRHPPPPLEILPPPQPPLVHRHPPPPPEILPLPQPPLVRDLSPTSLPLVEDGFRNFLAMMMNWATAGWVVLFLAIGCCAFLLLQR